MKECDIQYPDRVDGADSAGTFNSIGVETPEALQFPLIEAGAGLIGLTLPGPSG
jgi:hypothetical protein